MLIKQSDLFLGTSMDFVKKFMDISQMTSHNQGDILFQKNDPAGYFYILLDGCVQLRAGEKGQAVYCAEQVGEAFGWSSLIGREVYSASAECIKPTKLLKTNREKLSEILESDPVNGLIFFKHLAGTLGNRLLESYRMIAPTTQND